jgi:glycopeptide antibiotics resistance protein
MSRRTWRVVAIVLLAVLAAGVLALILSPVPIFGDQKRIYQLAIDLHEAGWPYWINFAFFERMANVVLFIPVGALLAATLPRRMQWLALILVLVLAAGLETAQLLLAERRSSILDVVLNTAGGAVGVGLTAAVRGVAAAVSRRRRHARTAG